ncbi:MAG: hypothetical protein ACRDJP_11030 [Actinomycetota bacterium]
MLRFERQVVATLLTVPDQPIRDAVEEFVEGTLRDMPEHLRAGVMAESIAFGTLARLWPGGLTPLLGWLERSPIGLVRQYVRLFRGLVLFAEQELLPDPAR